MGARMYSGMRLSLYIGPGFPSPVSADVMDALTGLKVTNTTEGPSVFQLTFTLSTHSILHTLFLLTGGSPIPLVRVIVAVDFKGSTEVLIDGVMTNHEISPGPDAGHATLTVSGEDLTRVMDYIDFSGIMYPCMPAEARVALIIAKYSMFGIIPLVIPSLMIDVPLPMDVIPKQRGKDLCYVRHLADEVGYVFYMEPGPTVGMSTAYWGPEFKVGAAQPALNINMDAHTNVESLSFNFNTEKKTTPVVWIYSELIKSAVPIPIPDVTPLNPPLGAVPLITKNIMSLNDLSHQSPIKAALIGLAKAARSSDAVFATGSLNVLRYGQILKARRLVGVRGAGTAFDGLYFVKSVTHNIKRGEYRQEFTLTRNSLISTLEKVPV
jgi:hypothetical protein